MLGLIDVFLLISIVVMPMDPSTMLPLDFLGIQLSVSRIVVIVSTVFLLFEAMLRRRLPNFGSLSLFFVWIIWYFISSFWGLNLVEPSSVIKRLFILVFIVLIVLFSNIEQKKGNLRKALMVILFLSVLSALIEQITGYRPPASRQHFFASQLTGFFFNPDFLGCTIALLMPWLLDLEAGLLGNLLKLSFFLVSLFVVVRTASYGALAAMVISCGVYLVLRNRLYGFIKLIGLIVACVIFILVGAQIGWLPSANVEKFFAIVEFGETISYQSRVLIWNQTLQLLSGHLLFGYGAGASEDILGFSPHNLLFEIWVECGLVGVFLFLVGFSFIFIELALRLHEAEAKVFLSSLAASMPVWLTLSSVLPLWPFWVILGGAWACAFSRTPVHEK